MKITRTKSAFVIRCNAGEFEALQHMLRLGQKFGSSKDTQGSLSNSAKKAVRNERFTSDAGALGTIDDDRSQIEHKGPRPGFPVIGRPAQTGRT